VVHNETSTGVTSRHRRRAPRHRRAGHPALLMVDTISGLASADYRHDEWGVDVTVSGSQKGLMLPPGISFNACRPRRWRRARPRSCRARLGLGRDRRDEQDGYWPYTPSTNLLYGLREALDMLLGRAWTGLRAPPALGRGVRAAVQAWGLPIQCADPAVYSPVLTGVVTPEGVDADALRALIHQRFDLSLGTGLGKVKGRMFRIGHLGDCNDLTLLATLAASRWASSSPASAAGSGVCWQSKPPRCDASGANSAGRSSSHTAQSARCDDRLSRLRTASWVARTPARAMLSSPPAPGSGTRLSPASTTLTFSKQAGLSGKRMVLLVPSMICAPEKQTSKRDASSKPIVLEVPSTISPAGAGGGTWTSVRQKLFNSGKRIVLEFPSTMSSMGTRGVMPPAMMRTPAASPNSKVLLDPSVIAPSASTLTSSTQITSLVFSEN
jgi:hypothetical protein